MQFQRDILQVDCQAEIEKICDFLLDFRKTVRRNGVVVGLSGGIDSAVTLALCIEAFGKERVLGVILPEKESSPISARYAQMHADAIGLETELVDITPTLEGFGTYTKRDAIVNSIFPEYTPDYKLKISLPANLLERDAFNFFTITIADQAGNQKTARLNKNQLNAIVAATDTKQRTRMMHLYYYAEKNNYFVCGTTNKNETVQGFFVKYGDGGVDVEPIAHLYKSQVYALARHLNVIEEIIQRPPSPDTYSFEVTDEEFYFRMPYDVLDPLLYAWEQNVPTDVVARELDLTLEQVNRAFRDFNTKYRATQHLRQSPPDLLLKADKEIS